MRVRAAARRHAGKLHVLEYLGPIEETLLCRGPVATLRAAAAAKGLRAEVIGALHIKESDSAAGEWVLAARIVVDAELEAEVAALA